MSAVPDQWYYGDIRDAFPVHHINVPLELVDDSGPVLRYRLCGTPEENAMILELLRRMTEESSKPPLDTPLTDR